MSEERELPGCQAGEQGDRHRRYELYGGLAALVTEHAPQAGARGVTRQRARVTTPLPGGEKRSRGQP